jgi:protein-tyrosine-phosphatase
MPRDSETVVFVCEHGTVKSVVAFAYFNELARQRHLAIRAVSRGTDLESAVPAFVRDGLRRGRLILGSVAPTALADADLWGALAVVTLDRPAVANKVVGKVPSMTWNDLPAVSANYEIARDSIRTRVNRLVDSLARRGVSPRRPRGI